MNIARSTESYMRYLAVYKEGTATAGIEMPSNKTKCLIVSKAGVFSFPLSFLGTQVLFWQNTLSTS